MPDPTLHHPRIICLHGGGTNARIFRTQCRALRAYLAPFLRLVFVDAPFVTPTAGPDVLSVYADWSPFRSWVARPITGGDLAPSVSDEEVARRVDEAVERALQIDAGMGDVVGVLGFSQGANMAARLLMRAQLSRVVGKKLEGWKRLRFGVIMAGRGPLTMLEREWAETWEKQGQPLLRVTTVHVHGLKDPGLAPHRVLAEKWCEGEGKRLVEWEGEHRVPVKTPDVKVVVGAILEGARTAGILEDIGGKEEKPPMWEVLKDDG